jgi:cellulose synthase/poly-beta-1,6-N-acetylglucosamine synthase-like glycosyltransferase
MWICRTLCPVPAFGFDVKLLDRDGWQTRTIVEDLEFSMQQNFKGVFSKYQDRARFYDEQPVTLRAMVSQLGGG